MSTLRTITLPGTDITVPPLAIGTMYWGIDTDEAGVPERLALLVGHRQRVRAEQRRIAASLKAIDGKIADYTSRLDG